MKNDRTEYFKKYRASHRESLNEYHRQWARKNPDKIRAYKKKIKNKKKGITGQDPK